MEYSILIYQRAGQAVDWYSEQYYGPFATQVEREEWLALPENQLDRPGKERYVVQFLTK